eukprot:14585511-Alexandrium_andersonii.AAC.1
MSASLVGSEMCIRDRSAPELSRALWGFRGSPGLSGSLRDSPRLYNIPFRCLLYTSDAADDM